MQTSDISRRVKLQVGDLELTDITRIGELNVEDIKTEVPSINKIVTVKSGVSKMPVVPITLKIRRDSPQLLFLKTWRDENESYDVSLINIDGHDREYWRIILVGCELTDFVIPEYDATSPVYAQIQFNLLVEEVVPL
jgi:hypothetical protein